MSVFDLLSRDGTWSSYAEANDLVPTLPTPGNAVVQTRGLPGGEPVEPPIEPPDPPPENGGTTT